MRHAVSEMRRPRFALNPQSDAAHARLIVLDEVSMLGEEVARDLMSFGKPILVLGDPGRLPPIKGEGAFTKDAPDIVLTEIHRKAGQSRIIRLATMARQGEPIGFGRYDTMEVAPELALRGGQLRHERHGAAAQQRDAPGVGMPCEDRETEAPDPGHQAFAMLHAALPARQRDRPVARPAR